MALRRSVDARLKALEKEVQVLRDREEIRELLALFAYNNDWPDYEAVVELFAPEGEMNLNNRSEGNPKGRKQLLGFYNAAKKDPTSPHGKIIREVQGNIQHLMDNNVMIRADGNEAEAVSYQWIVVQRAGVLALYSAVWNQWKFQRIKGKWRIAYRYYKRLGPQGEGRKYPPAIFLEKRQDG